jgi:hypothetical protein
VTGIGQQRHRAAHQTGRDLNHHETQIQRDRKAKRATGPRYGVAVIMVIVMVVSVAAVVVNPRTMVMRAAHCCPFLRGPLHNCRTAATIVHIQIDV